jgi:hypothetical protein
MMAYMMRTENMFNLEWRTVNEMMLSVRWHRVRAFLYSRVEEFFVIVMTVVNVKNISEFVFRNRRWDRG